MWIGVFVLQNTNPSCVFTHILFVMSSPSVLRAEEGDVLDDNANASLKRLIPETIPPPVQKSETSSSERISIDMNIRDSFWTPPSDMSKRDVKRPLPVRPLRCIRDPRFNQHVHMFKWLCFWIVTVRFSQPPVPPAISIAPEVDVVEVCVVFPRDV